MNFLNRQKENDVDVVIPDAKTKSIVKIQKYGEIFYYKVLKNRRNRCIY